ncbi:hypothetical protein ACTXGU_00220 [Niallia sp. 01092]|uniref:hypothetical protein n=1 Tax=Niallia sp. 01092 TaxID=3457759 RepID=UPI003FD54248
MRLIITLILLLPLIAGCSSVNKEPKKTETAASETEETKEDLYTRKITEEEQKYIQLVLDKKYEQLLELTKNSADEVKVDYNKISFAFRKYQEGQELEKNGVDESNIPQIKELEVKYYYALTKLEEVKFIPDKIKKQVKDLEKRLQEKENRYRPIVDKYDEQQEKEREQQRIEDEKRELAEQAKLRAESPKTVSIGMTKEEVLADGWGMPDHVNRTTTANGTDEQWVYGEYSSKYLYFEDGVLTTIQD